MEETDLIKIYKDRLRIFLILYYFSEEYFDSSNPHLRKRLTSEVKIQKLDFFLRNPDYLAFELLNLAKIGNVGKSEIKEIVKKIFDNREPELRKLDMEKFFFGAYEDIDDVIGFLKSIGLIDFSSNKNLELKITDKKYYITDKAVSKVEQNLPTMLALQWYVDRIKLIKNFFGHLTGNELRNLQYKIEEYKTASWGDYINEIQGKVKEQYFELFGEHL